MSIQSRAFAVGLGALVIVVCAVSPAFAHSEFRPDNAPAATTATVNLFVPAAMEPVVVGKVPTARTPNCVTSVYGLGLFA